MVLTTHVNGDTIDADVTNADNAFLNALMPVGAVIPWLKSYTNTPALGTSWVECNGQVLSDVASVFNGQTIPDLNGNGGTKRFLRGSATSGTTGGSDTQTHTHTVSLTGTYKQGSNNGTTELQAEATTFTTSAPSDTANLPSYYEVVFIMRVK